MPGGVESKQRARSTSLDLATLAAALLLAACASAVPTAPPAPTFAREPALDLTIAERMAVFVTEGVLGATARWEVHRGTRWPAGKPAVGLYAKREGRFERVLPGGGAVVSSRGAVLVLGEAPILISEAGSVKLAAALRSASFSPDGARILGVSGDAWVMLDARDGREIARREVAGEGASADVVAWRGETLLIGEEGGFTVIRADDLATVIAHATGPPSPTGELVVDAAETDYTGQRPRGSVGLRVLDARTGEVRHVYRGPAPRYDRAGFRDVRWLPGGRRLAWMSDAFHVLDMDRSRVARVPAPSLGEGDAESSYRALPTVDGSRVCFMMDGREALHDVARRAPVRVGPGRAARCAIAEHVAHVVEIPLGRGEAVVDLVPRGFGTWPDAVISGDRSRAAAIVADARVADAEARPIALLLVDVAEKRVLHRLDLGRGAADSTLGLDVTDDGRAVDVTAGGETRRVDFATGAAGPVPEAPPPPPAPRAPFAAVRATPEIAGAAVLYRWPEGAFAARLDRSGPALAWPPGCAFVLSPRGDHVLRRCDDRAPSGAGTTIHALVGEPRRADDTAPPPPLAGGAVAVTAGALRLHAQPSGATIATLVPHARGAIALFADGRVDWLGDPVAAPDFLCLRGDEAVPLDRCAPLLDRGALARVFAGR